MIEDASRNRRKLRQDLATLIERSLFALVPKLLGYSVVDMLAELSRDDVDRSAKALEASAWIDRARTLGFEVYVDQSRHRVGAHMLEMPEGFEWDVPELEALPESAVHYLQPIAYRTSGALADDLVLPFAVPVPHIFQVEMRSRYAAIPTLGHLLAAATADRQYLRSLLDVPSMHEALPLFVLALVQVPTAALPFLGFPPRFGSVESRTLSARAADWLTNSLPTGLLDGHPVEDALHALAVRLLNRSSEGNELSGWFNKMESETLDQDDVAGE